MYFFIIDVQRQLIFPHIIGRVQNLLVVYFDKNEHLFYFCQMFHVFQILFVDTGSEPNHENDSCDDYEDIKESVDIGKECKLYIKEIKVLQWEYDCIE